MNPDELLEELRRSLMTAPADATRRPIPRPPAMPTIGPRSGTEAPSVAEPRVSAGRLATELGVGMTPASASPDVAAMIRDAAEGDYGGAALNATFATMGMVPFGGALSRGARGLFRRAFGTHEFIPGKGAGHLSGLLTATPAEREAYSRAVDWRDPEGRDILYRAAGLSPDATRQATGLYRTPSGIETNPLSVARAQAPATEAGRSALNTVEGVRALLNAQNAGAYHSVTASPTGTGIRLPMVGPADPDMLTRLDDIAQNWRGGAVDTGRGVTILGPTWGDPYPTDAMFSDLRQSLSSVPLTGRPYVADTQPQGYFSLFEDAPPGGGQATRTALQNADPQTLMALGQDPEVLSRINDFRRADFGAQARYGPTNPAIERFREEAARPGGLSRLWQMAQNNGLEGRDLPGALLAGGALGAGAAEAFGGDREEGGPMQASLLGGLLGAGIVGGAAGLLTGRPKRVPVYQNAPDEFRRITPRLPLPEHLENFERFYGKSVLRDPQGVPIPVVHGTSAPNDFNRFRMPDEGSRQLGIHVTVDPRQAGSGPFSSYDTTGGEGFRLLGRQIEKGDASDIAMNIQNNMRQGGRSMPLWARAENPLRLPDLGTWRASNVMDAIEEKYPDLYDDIAGIVRRSYDDIADFDALPQTERAMRRALRDRGFDSIVYRNQIEGVPWRVRNELPASGEDMGMDFGPSKWYRDEILQSLWPEAGDAYIMFDPRQIKSAIGNDGGFRRNTTNINRGLLMGLLGGGAAGGLGAYVANQPEVPDA